MNRMGKMVLVLTIALVWTAGAPQNSSVPHPRILIRWALQYKVLDVHHTYHRHPNMVPTKECTIRSARPTAGGALPAISFDQAKCMQIMPSKPQSQKALQHNKQDTQL